MDAQVVLRDVASPAPHLVHLHLARRLAPHARPDGAAVRSCPFELQGDPTISVERLRPEEVGRVVDVVHEDVDGAVVVVVAEGRPAAGLAVGDRRTQALADVLEPAVGAVAVHDLALLVPGLRPELLDLRIDVAVHQEQVEPAAVLEVGEADAPAQEAGVDPDPGHERPVFTEAVPGIRVEGGGVAREIGDEHVHGPVVVVVSHRHPHPRLGLAVLAVGAPAAHAHVGEGPVVVVAVERVRVAVVGHVQVAPAVAVEVEGAHAEGIGAARLRDARFLGDVGEGAAAVVVVEDVLAARQPRRAAGHRDALVATEAGVGGGSGGEVQVDVVGHEKVQAGIAIIVEERAARAPARPLLEESRLRGDVLESAVATVVVEPVLSPVGHGEVDEAVVVVIARAGSLPPAAGSEPRPCGHVLEGPVAPVPVEVIRRLLALREALEGGPVDQERVEPTVVVVVEEGGAAARGFEQVPVRRLAAEDRHRGEPGRAGDIRESEAEGGFCLRRTSDTRGGETQGEDDDDAKSRETLPHFGTAGVAAGGVAR